MSYFVGRLAPEPPVALRPRPTFRGGFRFLGPTLSYQRPVRPMSTSVCRPVPAVAIRQAQPDLRTESRVRQELVRRGFGVDDRIGFWQADGQALLRVPDDRLLHPQCEYAQHSHFGDTGSDFER
jgi:hypothetical protein